uniref:Centrosomal protein CEP170 n=1 Tax=Rhipicephalus zambeziensis TaxID=60191 RepID=A0A224YV45_9ACAR
MDHRSDSKWVLTSKDGTVHPLPAGMIFIGRQECDIIVDSASVDKRHAVIFFNPSDKCFHVKDLNSVTGTYLNGVRIPEQSYVKLNHLDSLRFGYGHEVFCVHKTTDRAVPLDSASPKRNPPTFGDGDLVIREDADSLEDLSRTEDSLSTVREVLPPGRPPPTKPTTLSWKPLHSPSKPHAPLPPARPEGKGDDESSPGGSGTKSTASKDEQSPCPDTPASQTQASGSTAMAFTIHFDNDTTGGRPLALKDSIRKFAPPKPESERTPSKSRASPVSKPGEPSPTVNAGGRRTPTSPTNAADLAKRRWSGAEVRNRSSGGGGGWSSDVEPSRQGRRQDDQRLSDSASYLIQRMLNDGPARAPLPGPVKGVSSAAARGEPSSGLEQVLSPADDRSETGTYTVETDRVDPDVEEARRRIDEVFGVSSYNHPSSVEQFQVVPSISTALSGGFQRHPRSVLRWTSLCHPQKAAVPLGTLQGSLRPRLCRLPLHVPMPRHGSDWAPPEAVRVLRALRPEPTGQHSPRLHRTKSCRRHLVMARFYGRRQRPAVPPSAAVHRRSASHGGSPAPKPTWQPAAIWPVAPRRLPVLCRTPARSRHPTARAPGVARR